MKRLARYLLITAGTVGSLTLVLFLAVRSTPDFREVEEFEGRFSTVTLGDSKEKVIEVLGEPDAVDIEFRLGQLEGYEDAYERARDSGTKKFAYWFRGIDVVFAIGFDENEKVISMEYGGT